MGMFDDIVAAGQAGVGQAGLTNAPAGQPGGMFGDIVTSGRQAASEHQTAVARRRDALREHLPTVAGGIFNSAVQGATLGWGDEIAAGVVTGGGFLGDYGASVERRRLANAAFREFHPYLHFGAEAVGSLPTMFAPVVGAPARAVQAMRAASTPGQYLAAGARIGGRPGAVAGAGHADPSPNAGMIDGIAQRGLGAGVGWGLGTALGAGIGSLANAGNVATRLAPGYRAGSDAAQMLETNAAGDATQQALLARQRGALRDISLELQRDNVDPAQTVRNLLPTYRNGRGGLTGDQIENVVAGHLNGEGFQAIAARIGATESQVRRIAQRFDDEVRPRLEGSNVMELIRTPARHGEVVAAPNMTSLAYQATRSEGRGQQVAQQRLLQRQADEGDQMAGLIGEHFGAQNFEQHAQQFRDMLQGRNRQMYANMYANNAGPVITVAQTPALRAIAGDQAFTNALRFAAREATIAGDPALAAQIMAGQLDARAVDMVQRALRRSASGLTDPSEAYVAHRLRGVFLDVADTAMPDFWGNRGVFRMGMLADEALDLGRQLSVRRGGSDHPAWQFWRQNSTTIRAVDAEMANTRRLISAAAPGSNAVANLTRQLQMAQAQRTLLDEAADNFRRSFGAGLLDELNRSGNANRFLTASESRVFRQRVLEILGDMPSNPTAAQRTAAEHATAPFLEAIATAQRQKQTVNAMYGNSETAPRLMKAMRQNPLYDTAAGIATLNPGRIVRGATEMVSNRMREVRYERIADLLSTTDVRETFNLLRLLRDEMARQRLPNPPAGFTRSVDNIINRLPTPLRSHVRATLGGNEIQGADLLTYLTRVLSAYATGATFNTQRQPNGR